MKNFYTKKISVYLNCKFLKIFGIYIVFILFGSQNLQAQYTAIPDTHFEQALFNQGIDTVNGDHQVLTSAISGITSLGVSNNSISDLTGIQNFVALISLDCGYNQITNLNVSMLTNLTELRCPNNLIENLNVNSLINLKILSCNHNSLTSLDVSSLTNLEALDCNYNSLTSIDVSSLTNLIDLSISYNQITTSLDVHSLTHLMSLVCGNNLITSIDVSSLTNLRFCFCGDNHLTSLNLCNTPSLAQLYCINNLLTVLDTRTTGLQDVNNYYYDFAFFATVGNNIAIIYVNDVAAASSNPSWNIDATTTYSTGYGIGGTVSSNQSICSNAIPNDLVLTGNVGAILKWQKALNSNFTNPIDIAVTSTTLPGASVGSITTTTYIRAVVQNSPCSVVYSTYVTINAYNATVAGTASANQTIDMYTAPNDLTLTGNTATILKWQKSTDPYFSTFTDINMTASTLSGATVGALLATTYFRVVLQQSGGCSEYYSNTITIEVVGPFTTIPDANFEQTLFDLGIDTINGDHRVLTSAVSGITTLDVSYKNISDLSGIQDFIALTELYCSGNQISSIDVHSLTNLVYFDCSNNQLTSLDVHTLTNLNDLNCGSNLLTSLDVHTLTNLSDIDCSNNQITNLDLHALTALVYIYCNNNLISNLNTNALPNLFYLVCSNNQLTSLDLQSSTALNHIDCNNNLISNLNINALPHLTNLNCSNNQLTSLNLCANTQLNNVNLSYTNLLTLDIRGLPSHFLQINVSNNNYFTTIYINSNISFAAGSGNFILKDPTATFSTATAIGGSLSSSQTIPFGTPPADLTLTGNTGNVVKWQKASDAAFTSPVDIASTSTTLTAAVIGNLTSTTYFRAVVQSGACSTAYSSGVGITTVAYTAIPDTNFEQALFDLGIDTVNGDHRVITSAIDALTTLDVSNKNITDLTGIQDFISLTILNCQNNQITTLNVNSLTSLVDLYCSTNLLTTLQVDNLINLLILHCDNNQISALNVSALVNLQELDCGYNALTNLNISTLLSLSTLNIQHNQISTINFDSLNFIYNLTCNDNLITTLNVSTLTNLNFLECTNNQLGNLDVSALTLLRFLRCSHNLLTHLNVCNNTLLTSLITNYNDLKSIDVRNLSTIGISVNWNFTNNINLTTIYVNSSVNYANTAHFHLFKDSFTALSTATAVGGSLSADQTICSGTRPADITLTGNVGTVAKWQKSSTSDFSSDVTDIANTSTTLTGATIGTLSTTTYFRAVVESGSCAAVANSTTATVSMGGNSIWNGNLWAGGLPNSTKNVIITGNKTITSDLTACSCHVNGTAQVVVNSGVNLTVVNNVIVEAGASLTIQNNANLIQVNESTNIGNITVIRNSAPIIRLDHTLWSTPVTGAETLQQFSPNTLTNRFYYYNNATDVYSATSPSGVFPIGKAVAIRAANNWVSAPETPWTGTFIGVPNNGIINYSLQNAGLGYNGVGNPYPSCINGSAFVTANSNKITGTLYFYAHTLSMNSSGLFPAGTNYSTWNPGMGGTPATVGGGGTGSNPAIPNGTIEIGQGFIVKATQSGALEFNNSMRIGNNSNQFFKSGNNSTAVSTEYPIERHRIWLSLSNSTNPLNTILVGYADGATNGVDTGYDGVCLVGTGSYFYSILSNQEYTIQGRLLPFMDTDIVPLGFKATETNNYTISLFNTDGLFSGSQDIFILDTLTGITHNLKTSNYTFTSDAGVFENRFYLKYTNDNLSSLSNSLVSNELKVYEKNGVLFVKSTLEELQSIQVYDIQGRKLFSKENIQNNSFQTNELSVANEVLFVEVTTGDNHKKTIKVEF